MRVEVKLHLLHSRSQYHEPALALLLPLMLGGLEEEGIVEQARMVVVRRQVHYRSA